jgi:uncharacterized lipoprotein YajG
MKSHTLIVMAAAAMLTGCAVETTKLSSEPDFRSPAQVRADRGTPDNKQGNFRDNRAVVNVGTGSFLVGIQGNTVSAIQTAR